MGTRRGEPVKHTCPDIDKMMAMIKDIVKQMDQCDVSNDKQVLIDSISDWSYELANIGIGKSCTLEELRASNDALRTWGNELYEEAQHLDEEIESLETKVSDLECTIDDLSEQIPN